MLERWIRVAPGQFKGLEPIWRNKWKWILMGWVSLPQRWLLNLPRCSMNQEGGGTVSSFVSSPLPCIFQALFMLAMVSFAGWELSNSLSYLSVCTVTFYTLLYFTRRSSQCRHLDVISQYFHLTVSKFQILHLGLWSVMNWSPCSAGWEIWNYFFCKNKWFDLFFNSVIDTYNEILSYPFPIFLLQFLSDHHQHIPLSSSCSPFILLMTH